MRYKHAQTQFMWKINMNLNKYTSEKLLCGFMPEFYEGDYVDYLQTFRRSQTRETFQRN